MGEKLQKNSEIEDGIESINNKYEVQFSGFTPEQRDWILGLLSEMKLPLKRVQRIALITDTEMGDFSGHRGHYSREPRAIFLNKSLLERVPKKSRGFWLRSTLAHEITHAFNTTEAFIESRWSVHTSKEIPEWRTGYVEQYKDAESVHYMNERIGQIAKQLVATGVYLNPYSRETSEGYADLFDDYLLEDIADWDREKKSKFVRAQRKSEAETHSILVELLFTNPLHLIQVDSACKKMYRKLPDEKKTGPYVSIVEVAHESLTALKDGLDGNEYNRAARRSRKFAKKSPF